MAAQQQQQGADNSLAPLWIMLLIFIIVGLIWYFGHGYIVRVIFVIKTLEAKVINLLFGSLVEEIYYMSTVNPVDVGIKTMFEYSERVGNYVRFPVIIILTILAYVLYNGNSILKFRRTYSMKVLADEERTNWPQITPVLGKNLVDVDITKGPWAMALTPMEFAEKYDLLNIVAPKADSLRQEDYLVSIKKGPTRQVFIKQVGRMWKGFDDLKMHEKALFAIFASRMNRDRDSAMRLINQLAISSGTEHLDFSGVEEILAKHKDSKPVKRVLSRHAYVLTVMASMLVGAREDGVVASSDFLWLKPVDRALWYMLNSIGRQTPFCEAGGPFAHWIAERALSGKIRSPMVDEAVKALEIGVSEIKYKPKNIDD